MLSFIFNVNPVITGFFIFNEYLLDMDLIRKIAKREILNEAAGISFIVRKWAKILKEEVETQVKEHKEDALAKIEADKTKKDTSKSNQLELDFDDKDKDFLELTDPFGLGPEDEGKNDPFYWEDEISNSGANRGTNSGTNGDDWSEWDEWESKFKFDKKNWRNREGESNFNKKKKNYLGYPESYSSGNYGNYGGYGGYGGYKPTPYVPPLEEVVVYGDSFPEEYAEFSVDMWVLKNSTRIEYDHYKSGYAESGEYIVYLNVPLTSMSESAFIHEIKHAYDDWNRMRHGGKPIRDTWEVKNIYTKDFEKLILGGSNQYHQMGPIVRNFYLGSKLETPAYLENEYDNAMVDYEGVAKKLRNFKASNYLDKRGNANQSIEREFNAVKKLDIPLFKKFDNVVDFLYWTEKYFNKRGEDIFRRIAKMRYVHNKPKPKVNYSYGNYGGRTTYQKPVEKEDNEIGDWVFTPENGWQEKDYSKKEEKIVNKDLKDLEKKYGVNQSEFEEGESIGGWKYSKSRGWYFDPDEEEDMPY